MKTNKFKKKINKFDLEKFSVAKLKSLRSISGGKAPGDDDKTVTETIYGNERKN